MNKKNIGRNDPCPCGSGKKYKKCCLLALHSTNRNANLSPTQSTVSDSLDIVNWMQQVIQKQKNISDNQDLFAFLHISLRNNVHLISLLIDHLLSQYSPDGRSQHIPDDFEQFMEVFCDTLYELRVLVEREHPWAIDIMNEFQLDATERVFITPVDIRIQHRLKIAIYDAGITVQQKLQEKVDNVNEYYEKFTANKEINLDFILNDQGKKVKDPFELIEPVMTQLNMLPIYKQLMSIIGLLKSGKKLLGELAVIMFLCPDSKVRRKLYLSLPELLDFNTISSVSLRRMIGFRNWLPENERPALDNLIHLTRTAKVDCAPLLQSERCKAYASPFDGSGAQGFKLIFNQKNKNRLNHVLVKQQLGIKDAWINNNASNKYIKVSIDEMAEAALLTRVDSAYFKRAISHFIQVGLEQNRVPLPALLQTAELSGEYWKPKNISISDEIESMEAITPDTLNQNTISRVLESCGDWPIYQPFASSWLEDNASVEAILLAIAPSNQWHEKMATLSMKILDKIIEPKRFIWAERLMLMAIWAKNTSTKDKFLFQSHMINARALQQGTPLEEIPLMVSVAARTILSAKKRVESQS